MKAQSIANKKQRMKSKEAKKDYSNDLIFNSVNEKCVYCNKKFTLELSDKNKLEKNTQNWLKFYQERPMVGVIEKDTLTEYKMSWHGLCFWQYAIENWNYK